MNSSNCRGFFEDMFDGYSESFMLPTDKPEGNGGTFETDLDIATVDSIAKRNGVPGDAVCFAAFAYALSRFSGGSESVFVLSGDGIRVPVRLGCGDRPVEEFLKEASEMLEGCRSHACKFTYKELADLDMVADVVYGPPGGGSDFAFEASGTVRITYGPNRSRAMVERFAGLFRTVLEGFGKGGSLGGIAIQSEEDARLVEAANQTYCDLGYETLVDIWEIGSRGNDGIFCKSGDRSVTYQDAERISRAVASFLIDSGIERGSRVAYMTSCSEWYMLATLSVTRAGCSFVPLDMRHPDERIADILDDCGAVAVLVDAEGTERMSSPDLCGYRTIRLEDASSHSADSDLPADIEGSSEALVIYTSGSTGKPKGVSVTHLALANTVSGLQSIHSPVPIEVAALWARPVYIPHHFEQWINIVRGITSVIVPDELAFDPAGLAALFKREGITQTFLVSQLAKIFLRTVGSAGLRLLCAGGDVIGTLDDDRDGIVSFMYGSSEAAISNCSFRRERCDGTSVGPLISNANIYIVDAEMRQVPYGAVGELCVAGYGVTPGYVNNEALTRERLVPNPFCDREGFRTLFRTGDYGRFLPDGSVGIMGRRDGMVKIRGHRVELSEVESAIHKDRRVGNLAVIAREGPDGERDLVAYIVSDEGITPGEVRSLVESCKPPYMVPTHVVMLDSIPMTLTGKVDRAKLPDPEFDTAGSKTRGHEPADVLARAMSQAIGAPGFGPNDDFTRNGGDSLKAAKVITILKEMEDANPSMPEMSTKITPVDILKLRKPRRIVASMEDRFEIVPMYTYESGFPLTDSMMSMYFLNGIGEFGACISMRYTQPEWTDPDKLEAAIRKVVDDNPVMHAWTEKRDGYPWAVFPGGLEISRVEGDPAEELKKMARPFDLDHEPLSIISICKHGDTYSMLIHFSHVVMDGQSVALVIAAVEDAYCGIPSKRDDRVLLAAAYDRQIREQPAFQKSKEMFLKVVEGLPRDQTLPVKGEGTGRGRYRVLLDTRPETLRGLTDRTGVSFNILMSAAFGIALATHMGREESYFSMAAGRASIGVEDCIGCFPSSVPFRTRIGEDRDLSEMLNELAETAYDCMARKNYPSWEREADGIKHQFFFQYNPYLSLPSELAVPGFDTSGLDVDVDMLVPSTFMFNIEVINVGDLFGMVFYSPARYPDSQIEEIIDRFDRALESMCHRKTLFEVLKDVNEGRRGPKNQKDNMARPQPGRLSLIRGCARAPA